MKKATPVGAGMTFHIDSLPDAPEDITLLNNQIISFLERPGKGRIFYTLFFKAHQNLTGCNMGYNMGRNVD